MRPIRPTDTARRGSRVRRMPRGLLAVTAAVAVLALTATACGPEEDNAGGTTPSAPAGQADGKITIPDDLKDRLKEHGIDLDKWRDGEWKNWDKDQWLREAQDFVNPIIEDLWDPDRMREADKPPENPVDNDISGDDGVTDPTPAPVQAADVATPYHDNAPEAGKLLFDGPEGPMVCSATVVKDPANPGKSNMVWTAGHCVHAGKAGGWYRNIAFVPSYNNDRPVRGGAGDRAQGEGRSLRRVVGPTGPRPPSSGSPRGRRPAAQGAPYDFAVLHVTPEKGSTGKSLEETVGSALPVDFDAPAVPQIADMTATGYPAAPPFDGQKLLRCTGQAGPALGPPGRADDVPHRLHDDRWFLRRRLGRDRLGRASPPWCRTPRSARSRRAGWPVPGSARRPRASTARSARSTRASRASYEVRQGLFLPPGRPTHPSAGRAVRRPGSPAVSSSAAPASQRRRRSARDCSHQGVPRSPRATLAVCTRLRASFSAAGSWFRCEAATPRRAAMR